MGKNLKKITVIVLSIIILFVGFYIGHYIRKNISSIKMPSISINISEESGRAKLGTFLMNNVGNTVYLDLSGIRFMESTIDKRPTKIDLSSMGDDYSSLNIGGYNQKKHFKNGHFIATVKIVDYGLHQGVHYGVDIAD